jgi:LL-diaminopimelate aminotransferase
MKLSEIAKPGSEYIFARLEREKREVESKTGRQVLNLGAGNPDFPPSQKFIAELKRVVSADSRIFKYPGYRGTEELLTALRDHLNQRYNLSLETDQLHVLLGAKDGINSIYSATLDQGSEALIPDPGYQGYRGYPEMIGAKVVPYELKPENNFQVEIEELEKLLTPATRLIWVNYPSNPTGALATKETLTSLVEFAIQHDLAIAYDHAYNDIVFDGEVSPSILQVPNADRVAVELFSFSKSHSFAGLRIGYVAGNRELINAIKQVKSKVDSGLSIDRQALAAYVLRNPDPEWAEAMLTSYRIRRDILCHYLQTLGLKFTVPRAGLYIWAEVPEDFEDGDQFAERMLRDHQILVTPGSAFGKNGKKYVRISFCVNIEGINQYFPQQ